MNLKDNFITRKAVMGCRRGGDEGAICISPRESAWFENMSWVGLMRQHESEGYRLL